MKNEEEEDDPSLFQNSTIDEDVKKRRKMLLGETGPTKEKGITWWKQEFKKAMEGNETISREKLIEFRNKLLFTPDDLTKLMVEIYFNENLPRQVLPFAKRFKEYFSEKRTQRALLNSLIEIIGNKYSQFISSVPAMIKALYDIDCLQEDVILEWYDFKDDKVENSNEIRIKVAPLITWFKDTPEEN